MPKNMGSRGGGYQKKLLCKGGGTQNNYFQVSYYAIVQNFYQNA